MFLTIYDVAKDKHVSLEMAKEMKACDLRILVQCEFGYTKEIDLLYSDRILEYSKTLEENHITTDCALQLKSDNSSIAANDYGSGKGNNMEPYHRLTEQLNNDQHQLSNLRQQCPQLAEAVIARDVNKVKEIVDEMNEEKRKAHQEQMRLMRLAGLNPFDVEVQRKIEEQIHTQRIAENLQHAMEHNPEVFTQVHMLYIKCELNGQKLKAFVDSGAQMSILSTDCASKCNLHNLIDKRWNGVASGVGQAKIVGRIHTVPLKFADDTHLSCSFTILENQSVEFILGLDMLKRHQMCIDLNQNVLKIHTTGLQIPFLGEHEIPKDMFNQQDANQNASTNSAESTTTLTATTSAPSNDTLNNLMALGFDENTVKKALEKSNNNPDMAATLLLQ